MVTRKQISLLALLLFLLTSGHSAWSQTVRAYVDRNPITVDETVRLIVEQQGQATGEAPDLSALKHNFDILGTSQSSQTSIINGQSSNSIQWVSMLAPKHAGKVTIPPIHVGGQASEPLVVVVQEATQGGQGSVAKDVFLEATAEPNDPYVQSQIVYTLRLYHAVPLREGQIEDPQIRQAVVERVGEDRSFSTIHNGRRYQVIERRYLIVPQASGSLTIPSVLFSGQVPDSRGRRSLLDDMFGNRSGAFGGAFQSARLIRARSSEIALNVQEIPSAMKDGVWLPAQELTLTETWSTDPGEVKIGEPITRTITIHAKGLTGEQLPELTLSEDVNLKIYPDQPTITTAFDGSWAVGTREQKLALVPTQPGTVTIPEIRIRWWNLNSRKSEEAVLPAQSLTILGPSTVPTVPAGSPDKGPMTFSDSKSSSSTTGTHALRLDNPEKGSSWWTQWTGMGSIFVVIWVLTVMGWWYDRKTILAGQKTIDAQDAENTRRSLGAVRASVKKACLENSPTQTREALLQWTSVVWKGSSHRNLGSVAKKFSIHNQNQSTAHQAIVNLDRNLYAAQNDEWDGKTFWDVLVPEMKSLETSKSVMDKKNVGTLPSLYLHE
ncbi:MAG: BatD family protein [Nitrospirales bacterium]